MTTKKAIQNNVNYGVNKVICLEILLAADMALPAPLSLVASLCNSPPPPPPPPHSHVGYNITHIMF